jgi:hypothetical protein
MGTIIKFPIKLDTQLPIRRPSQVASKRALPKPTSDRPANIALRAVWFISVLCWPLIRFVLSWDCTFQVVRMLWFWNTPGSSAGVKLAVHFAFFVAMTCFVSLYEPRGALPRHK